MAWAGCYFKTVFARGFLFGLGGMAGVYVGSILQKKAPVKLIRIILGLALGFIAVRYLT